MRTTTKTLTMGALSLLIAACEMTPDLETRTFAVQHLQPHEVGDLIDPYVYGEREGAPGALSVIEGAVTIRETADNLAQIERVLAQFDQARPDVRLHFQLIEADGFTESDPRIAQVEDQLRRLFPFQGYRLAGEATVTATDVTEFEQGLRASDGLFLIRGTVYLAHQRGRMAPGDVRERAGRPDDRARILSQGGLVRDALSHGAGGGRHGCRRRGSALISGAVGLHRPHGRQPPITAPAMRRTCSSVSSGCMGSDKHASATRSVTGSDTSRYSSTQNSWRCSGIG